MEYSVESNDRKEIGVSKGLVMMGIAFAIALAVVVGNRLTNDSMAVLVGALCGISASVPACLALVIALKQNWGRATVAREENPLYRYPYQQPPVVMIAPPQTAYPHAERHLPIFLPPQMTEVTLVNDGAYPAREFKIIGEE